MYELSKAAAPHPFHDALIARVIDPHPSSNPHELLPITTGSGLTLASTPSCLPGRLHCIISEAPKLKSSRRSSSMTWNWAPRRRALSDEALLMENDT